MLSKIACFIVMMIQNSLSIVVQPHDTSQAPVDIHFNDFVKAWLQSTGIIPEDKHFTSSFYERLSDDDELCECNGCFIHDTCLRCVSFKNCGNINGTFCRD